MYKHAAIRLLSFVLLLSGSVVTLGRTVTVDTPGYVALKAGDYITSTAEFEAANIKEPHNAFDELNLGASYQRQGRMDLAEPWYRMAMTDGHNLHTADTTTELARGHTVEEIACQNLLMGLKPALSEASAKPCQTVITFYVVPRRAPSFTSTVTTEREVFDAPDTNQIHYNAYFDFDKAVLTADGLDIVNAAANEVLADPNHQISLVGNASYIGTDAHNMELSHLRVNAVRDAMIAAGVDASRIDVSWVGMRDLPVQQQPGVHEPANRVVEGTINNSQ